ncbi:HAD-IC family P-type ATPase [Schaalia sp. 19OD2882]|uniref:HAD-IC family P-type ATPase n=1 Tax=Schaalia sp. 19OD2882 TaxID=2794089 RepID=UPI001C1F1C43|nr:HAD-IC family P-type ATPase [Schaalia sp. 19OD2882]QWW19489.1 HAD-IC family P-type ATPase [Schaalia sp. 19OD2882]
MTTTPAPETPAPADHTPGPGAQTPTPSGQTPAPSGRSPAPHRIGEGARGHAADLSRRLWFTAPVVTVVVALSMVPALQFGYWQWVVAILSLPVVTWAAWPFHRAAFTAGRHGSTTMDTLVSLGVVVTSVWSWWALLFGGAGRWGATMDMPLVPALPWFLDPNSGAHQIGAMSHGGADIYFEGACTIVLFLLLGRRMEAKARWNAGDALRSLLEMGAKHATLVHIDPATGERSQREVPAEQLQVGDLFLVRPGEKVATDSIVVEGDSALDASLLTGESVPVDVTVGDRVTGATMNTWGTLLLRAERVGAETTLAQIGRLVTEAQAGKAPVQRLADRISGVFVPVVMAISLVTLVAWLALGGSVQSSVTAAVAVLVVACPCALGLATPTALLVGSGRAARSGILITSAEVLEQTRRVDTIVLDKTGTVTSGRMALESVRVAGSPRDDSLGPSLGDEGGAGDRVHSGARAHEHPSDSAGARDNAREDSLLALAAGVEALSEHPVARAVVAGANSRGVTPAQVQAFTNHAGLGVSALHTGPEGSELVLVGRASWLVDAGVSIPSDLREELDRAEADGASAVVLAVVPAWQDRADTDPADAIAPSHVGGVDALVAAPPVAVVEMDVQGMTCASCVRRVERKLGKVEGVSATVNLATESARITLTREVSNADLEAVVDAAGYRGRVLTRTGTGAEGKANLEGPAGGAIFAGTDPVQESPAAGKVWPSAAGAPASACPSVRARDLSGRLGSARAGAVLVVRDTVKPTSAAAVRELERLGVTPVMLTGDNRRAARAVGDEVGIDRVIAEVLPADKARVVADLQEQGHVVAMVGDGVNDAAALAQAGRAGLGMAMGSGTDVARQVADITLVNSELTSAAAAIRISRATLRTIKQNLFWAFAYNVAMIPLAMLGMLNPMIASAAMAFSSVFVVLNSLRLRAAS